MKNKAFTLIELLAVIVILAIIALIAVPIILNIIEDTKDSANKRSIDLYGKAVENAIANYQVNNTNDSSITLEKVEPYIKYDGNKVECDTKIYKDGSIYLSNCKVGGIIIDYTYGKEQPTLGKAVTEENKTLAGNIPQGNYELGDEYIINVDGEHEYHFYILSTEGDKVSLILNGNICSDGTLATSSNTCLLPWTSKDDYELASGTGTYGQNGNSNKGPITVMNYIYEATKDWNNINNITMNYSDEFNKYGEILTVNNETVITNKDKVITSTYMNLKARLPKYNELINTGCIKDTRESCPEYIVNGLNHYSSYYKSKMDIDGIMGYWILASYDLDYDHAFALNYCGHLYGGRVFYPTYLGVRPVIEVSKSDLS